MALWPSPAICAPVGRVERGRGGVKESGGVLCSCGLFLTRRHGHTVMTGRHADQSTDEEHTHGLAGRVSLSSRGSSSTYRRVCRFEPPHFGADCRGLWATAAKLTLRQQLCFVAPYRYLRGRYGRSRE